MRRDAAGLGRLLHPQSLAVSCSDQRRDLDLLPCQKGVKAVVTHATALLQMDGSYCERPTRCWESHATELVVCRVQVGQDAGIPFDSLELADFQI